MKHLALLILLFFTPELTAWAKPLAPPDSCAAPPVYLCTQPVVSNIICPQFCLDTASYTITEAHATFDCSLTLMGNCVRYIALPGYFGTDVVTVIACNALVCDTNTLYIEVVASPDLCTPTTTPPCEQSPSEFCTDYNAPNNVCPNFCFTQPYSLVSATSTHPAQITLNSQCFTYTPLLQTVSWDAITVIACTTDAAQCDTLQIQVALGNCNEPPPITPNQICTPVFTPIDLCFEMQAGEIYSDDAITTAFQCSINAFAQSCITYYPLPGFAGTDTVTIPVCMANNPKNCRLQQFVVHVGCEAPNVVNDIVYISPEWVSINGSIIPDENGYDGITLQPLQNDDAGCQAPVTISVITPPGNGTLTVLPDGQQLQYLPDAGFSGAQTASLQLCNACNQCSYSTLNLYIAPANTTTALPPMQHGSAAQPTFTAVYLPQNQAFLLTFRKEIYPQAAYLSLYNVNGQLLHTQPVASAASNTTPTTLQLPAAGLPAGLYLLRLQTATGNTAVIKVWKE